MWPDHAHFRDDSLSVATTYYDQPIYQIWSLYLHQLQRYERRYKESKMWWFGVTEYRIGVTENRSGAYEFLLAFYSNYVPMLHRFLDIATIGQTSPIWIYPTSIWCPRWGWHCRNFAKIFGVRKLESLGYHTALFAWSCILVNCRLVTDRQTDGHTLTAYTVLA